MLRKPNYASIDTTVNGLKRACKAVGLATWGSKIELCKRLAEEYQRTEDWSDENAKEVAYACFYANAHVLQNQPVEDQTDVLQIFHCYDCGQQSPPVRTKKHLLDIDWEYVMNSKKNAVLCPKCVREEEEDEDEDEEESHDNRQRALVNAAIAAMNGILAGQEPNDFDATATQACNYAQYLVSEMTRRKWL